MNPPKIKVGILENQDSISFKIHGDYILNDKLKLKQKSLKAYANGSKILLKENDNIIFSDTALYFNPVRQNNRIEEAVYKFEVENVVIGIDFHWEQKEREYFFFVKTHQYQEELFQRKNMALYFLRKRKSSLYH
jgi:hypothetical protein